ncbi:aminotransferase class-III [Pseudopedobacter saltans DSM 12145]|uniref:Aminotransferase class-III n=1 Tax=Pseudopedobacter saltans (strain ATCC 51119 / DSM 12145 / JCM 21818 / CCUG 39354 / LMG 10337 / NBRC 100064 / NCIMB 13643) TaxID=762903 RepID=F0SDN1_PSESL|nr:aspartate aminotransferase family protein [Pseudopedobacter saltans]ADY50758.1 aminotransferase class-III [Pseudopedobacter saltans DSM 12145]
MLSQKQLFLLNTAQTSNNPRFLEIEKAEGNYIFDVDGKKYLDLVSGFAVSNIGHRHPAVIKAIKKQLDRYLHVTVYGEYVQSPQVNFAHLLSTVLPEDLSSVYFTNSGTEATEGALKLAKRYTGRSEILAFNKAYHGSTHGALSVMGNEYYKQAYRPLLPNIGFLDLNNEDQLDLITKKTAAVILETIQGEAGVRVPDKSYFKKLRKKCSETGTLLILDEIQTGFGRTGKLFCFEHYDLVPDILLVAKGMGGGMPIGAFISSKEIMDSLKDNPILGHITTFGGHPVSCAAGLASLEIILKERLHQTVSVKEALFRKHLAHPKIKEVRGLGLMLSIQLDKFENVEKISSLCVKEGIIIDWFLHCETAMRIAPPLTITNEEIINACNIIKKTIDTVYDV